MASSAHESLCSNQALPTVLSRRPANYEHQTWDYNSICSMQQQQAHGDEKHRKQISLQTSLKQRVRHLLLDEEEDLATRLRIMEQLQSLGISYHFEEEIKIILMSMHAEDAYLQLKHDLSSTALLFRMLRGHGIPASTGMFIGFTDGNGNGLEATNSSDIKGYMALIEASYLAFPGEDMLDKARAFAIKKQEELVIPISMEPASEMEMPTDLLVDLPLHWRAPRLQAISSLKQHFYNSKANIESCEKIDPSILQLAAVDFNLVQAIHRAELVDVTKWWKDTGLGEKLPFARDRLVECFFCAVCIAPEPLLVGCREVLAKVGTLIIHLDDIYDLYGTMDELAAFTDAMGSCWDDDLSVVEKLPEYMKVMYSAIRSMSTVAADRVMKEQGRNVLPLYKKAWHELCMAFLVEAKWQHEETMPCLEEYLQNGWVTSTGPLLLLHALTMLQYTQKQKMDSWVGNNDGNDGDGTNMIYPKLVELCSRIFRLSNDCATHDTESEQGEAASAITCCMAESGGCASKQDALTAMVDAMAENWKEVNREVVCGNTIMVGARSTADRICLNLARIIQCIYQDGDGITLPKESRKQQVKDLLFTPIDLGIWSATKTVT